MALTAVVILFSIPLPCRVSAEAVADDGDGESVCVTFGGTLVDSAQIAQTVEAGQEIARLEDPRLKVILTQLTGELEQQRLRLEQLERRRFSEPNIGQVLPTVRETVRDLEQQLNQRQRDADRLIVKAPRSGIVIASPHQRIAHKSGSLTTWTGSPLELPNRGAFLRAGTTLCSIGSEGTQSALILINQDDINLVRIGQRVRFLWTALSGEIVYGDIVELSEFDRGIISHEMMMKLNVPVRVASRSGFRPIGKWYQARVKLDPSQVPLLRGTTGSAKILVDPRSLYSHIARWLARTFPL
jgi:putative peptide zinc metalloprotease protein